MQQLQKTDGTEKHLKAARYHIRRCRSTTTDPLFTTLHQEMSKLRQALEDAEAAVEKQKNLIIELSADVDAAELSLEDVVRDIKGGLERYDRRVPGRSALAKVLPGGVGAMINPDGEAQLGTIPPFRARLKDFEAEPELTQDVARFDAAVLAFEAALGAREAAEKVLAQLEVDEANAREEIRKQLVKANGQLEGLFSSRPALASRYFQRGARGNTGPSREDRARARGQAEALLMVLDRRNLNISAEDRKKLLETTDFAKLERWLDRALAAEPSTTSLSEEEFRALLG